MHIVEIPSFFPPYGGEFCLEQAKALKALGHEVRIVSNVQLAIRKGIVEFVSLPYGRRDIVLDGIPVMMSYMRGIPKTVRPNVRRWVATVRSMFAEYVRKYGLPDVIHAHCAKWAGYAAYLLSREYGVPFVITEHLSRMLQEQEFGREYAGVWQIDLLKEAYYNADMVVPVSEELVDDLVPMFGRGYRWTSISNVIDTEFFHYVARRPPEGRPYRFCCLANFIYWKGYDVLFEAFDRLYGSNCNVELHIAGRDTGSDECRAMFGKYASAGAVHVHGQLDRAGVRSLLYHCDALALATRSEAQVLAVMEAMSTGLPVVSTECVAGCLRVDGGCTIVPVDDVGAFADAMKKRVDEEFCDGRRLSDHIAALASPESVGRQLEAVFLALDKKHAHR